MINGNAVGGITGYGKTFILQDENGNEVVGAVVEDLMVFDADPLTDIRAGKKAVTDAGVVVGSTTIPNYETYTGTKVVPNGSSFVLYMQRDYDYTKLQAIICTFNTNYTDSVGAEYVVIEDNVFAVQSTESTSTIIKDLDNNSIDFGLINNSGNICLIRYFMYKELY